MFSWWSRLQYDRLKLIINNSRFLILPDWHISNLGSRILPLCQRCPDSDWQKVFGHPVVLLETFVDPKRFLGIVYKAANWIYAGNTKGFRRTHQIYHTWWTCYNKTIIRSNVAICQRCGHLCRTLHFVAIFPWHISVATRYSLPMKASSYQKNKPKLVGFAGIEPSTSTVWM